MAKANQYAADHGMRGFSVYQGRYNASARDMERELLPMCQSEGLACCIWAAAGGGSFKTEEQIKEMEKSGEKGRTALRPVTENDKKVTKVLEKLGKAKNKSLNAIALAYVLQVQPYMFPIVGARKVSHLKDNIEALSIHLSDAELKEINEATDFDVGFPLNFIGVNPEDMFLTNVAGTFDYVRPSKAIGHE